MFRVSKNTASGHNKWSQQHTASRSQTQNTATQWIPSAPLELADLLGFCSWKVACKLNHLDPTADPETMVDVGDETMATRTIEWVTQSLRLES